MANKTIFTGGYVATMDDTLGDYTQGAVLVENGLITAVGPVDNLADVGADVEVIDTSGGVVMPGMIDTHRHTCMSVMRGIGADQSLLQFLSNCFMRYLPATNAKDLQTAALVGGLEAIDAGVTTVLDPADACRSTAHSEAALRGLVESGVRGFFCFGMSDDDYDDAEAGRAGHRARLAHLDKMHERNANDANAIVRVGLSLSHPGTVPFDQTAEEIRFADERGMLCCSHSAGLQNSILTKGLMERADHGLMLPGHVYIHCTGVSDQEIALIAKTGGKVSIAVETEIQMGMGLPPFKACVDHGVNYSLSLDTSSVVAPDYLSQMRLALQLRRMFANEESHRIRKFPLHLDLTCRDAMIWGTRNGAEAVGLEQEIGTLTPGKKADIVFVSDKRSFTPSANPIGSVVLQSTSADVNTVMIDGVVRKRGGNLVGYDLDAVRARSEEAFNRISSTIAEMPKEMSAEQLKEFLIESERSTRQNFAKAYADSDSRDDWLRG